MSNTQGVRYVPPHLRTRPEPSSSSQACSSRLPATSKPIKSAPAPGRGQSRTPWATPHDSSPPSSDRSSSQEGRSRNVSPPRSGRAGASAPAPSPRGRAAVTPTLHVFGDSFVGPFKLLSEECVRHQTFKGASAKGLNNPNSIKQVAKDLLPALNNVMAPPPYVYMPSVGRWALLIFGNVDLQINYLWQLQHKPISHLSFPPDSSASSIPQVRSHATGDNSESAEDDIPDFPSSRRESTTVLASATETSLRGPALGPDLFVHAVINAYTAWLQTAIIDGPIGQRLRQVAEQRRSATETSGTGLRRRSPPPGKILIAAALPPLVEDDILYRIPEKYVERMEEDHMKAHKALESSGLRTPWASRTASPTLSATSKLDPLESGISTLDITDTGSVNLGSPKSSSSASSRNSSLFESTSSATSSTTTDSSSMPSKESVSTKTSIESLLTHTPPLCNLETRIKMTNTYNRLLSTFCSLHPDILSFIDISPQMLADQPHPSTSVNFAVGAVDRETWACPVDPTNIHPLWEPTLPLWLNELKKEGIPVEEYEIDESAEETFKAYELDKRRRIDRIRVEMDELERVRLSY